MTETIRWGILGAAKFARTTMGPAIHLARNASLSALATSDPKKADAFAALAPGLRVHSSYDAMLGDPDIDAVYIPLPNHIHAEWTQKAIAAGKHVLTEKPVGMSVSEIDGLIAARDRSGLVVAEAFMIAHHPQWLRARALVEQGEIGDVTRIDGAFCYDNRDATNIRNRAETGGGGLRDIGVYPIGAARFVMGVEPTLLQTHMERENDVDVFVDATCRLGAARFHFYVGTRMHLWQEMTFHGTAGVMRLTAPFNAGQYGAAEIHLMHPGKAARVEACHAELQYVNQVEAFGRSIREGAPYPLTLEFSRGTQALIDSIFAAV